jgi:transcriptional regulatory protein GAL4
MYRPYVIRQVFQARSQADIHGVPAAVQEAYNRCLREAEDSIMTISNFWSSSPPTRMSAWYALYFLFQASLIPCVCLRNEPNSSLSGSWRTQINQTLLTMQLILPANASAQDCHNVLHRLCGPFLQPQAIPQDARVLATPNSAILEHPTEESPQTQIQNGYSMMWPNANDTEVDMLMQGGLWSNFLPAMNEAEQQNTSGSNNTYNMQFPWS